MSVWRYGRGPGSQSSARRRQGQAPDEKPNIAAAAFGLIILTSFAALYMLRRETYFTVLGWWSFHPFRYPFLDLIYVPAQVECWQRGIDVYLQNPCDPLGRLQDYSPLWLRFSFLVNAKPFTNALGLSLDALFMMSLAALPRPRQRSDYLLIILGIVSPMTMFALERGNIDILMFLLALAAVVCMDRAVPLRLLGYGAIMLAGLLKFFPFVLFILLLRERPKLCLIGIVTVVCGVGGFTWHYLEELAHMAANIPRPSPFADAFGAAQLPIGIGFLLRSSAGPAAQAAGWSTGIVAVFAICLLVLFIAYMIARYLSQRADLQAAFNDLTSRESLCLVAGATLVCGCFFSADSIGYREIIILLALPGLTALARSSSGTLAIIVRVTTWIAVFLMTSVVPQRLIHGWFGGIATTVSWPAVGFWLVRELCWWWFVAVLGAILTCFVRQSPLWSAISEPSGWQRRLAASPPNP
jgi:hypothetical protein